MSKSKRVRSHDGKTVRVGMKLWPIETRDGGVTWFARSSPKIVGKVSNNAVTCLEPLSTFMSAESRLFSSLEAAQKEAKLRTAKSKPYDGWPSFNGKRVREVTTKPKRKGAK